MYQSVSDAFIPFSTQFEGRVNHMYVDVKGLITIGIGNLIDNERAVDPVGPALPLHFVMKSDGSDASEEEIRSEWQSLKADKDELARLGWKACTPRTNLMLTDADIDDLVRSKAVQFESTLKMSTPEFADFDNWPADAQLGVMSMAWAMGPAFGKSWPSFCAAVNAGEWNGAADKCRMNEAGNPGLKPRNNADQQLFRNTATAVEQGLDFSVLQYQVPRATLREGSTNGDVQYLQQKLEDAGFGVDVTGTFDAATKSAVQAFQSANGLVADGVVGPKTWEAIG